MVRLLVNPVAGSGRGMRVARRLAAETALDVRLPASPGELEREVRSAVEDGEERLLVAGGDGTWLRAARVLAGTRCALGPIPVGSGNDLARSLRVPLDPQRAVARALAARPRAIDLGEVDGHAFVSFAAVGLNAEVARFANERAARRGGPWLYPWALLRTVFGFTPPTVRIEADGFVFRGAVALALFANTGTFGGGMRIAPEARPDDGRLDLVVVKALPAGRLLSLFPRVYLGRHVGHPSVRIARLRDATMRVEPPTRELYADGEPQPPADGATHRVAIRAGALRVVV